MCALLGISRSGYYQYLRQKDSKRKVWQQYIITEIKQVYEQSKQVYGSPRIRASLINKGIKVSRLTVERYMRSIGIRSIMRTKYVTTTDTKHNYTLCENLLNRNFNTRAPAKALVSDITYVNTQEGWLYLTTVIDLYDRKVIGKSISNTMDAKSTVIEAFKNAINRRNIDKNTIFHSDRGVQYACKEFTSLLHQYTLLQSMSRKGNCWDNAVAESFFATFKKECVRKKVFYSITVR
jgi:putative transposase